MNWLKNSFKGTRYNDLVYVRVNGQWSFVDEETSAQIGPWYCTKDELLADMAQFATDRGFSI